MYTKQDNMKKLLLPILFTLSLVPLYASAATYDISGDGNCWTKPQGLVQYTATCYSYGQNATVNLPIQQNVPFTVYVSNRRVIDTTQLGADAVITCDQSDNPCINQDFRTLVTVDSTSYTVARTLSADTTSLLKFTTSGSQNIVFKSTLQGSEAGVDNICTTGQACATFPSTVNLPLTVGLEPICVDGWSPEELSYDGWAGTGAAWCNATAYGACAPGTVDGSHEKSVKGSVTICCRGAGIFGWIRSCDNSSGLNLKITKP